MVHMASCDGGDDLGGCCIPGEMQMSGMMKCMMSISTYRQIGMLLSGGISKSLTIAVCCL